MSPSGNGPTLATNEVNHSFQILTEDDKSLKSVENTFLYQIFFD